MTDGPCVRAMEWWLQRVACMVFVAAQGRRPLWRIGAMVLGPVWMVSMLVIGFPLLFCALAEFIYRDLGEPRD